MAIMIASLMFFVAVLTVLGYVTAMGVMDESSVHLAWYPLNPVP